MILGIIIFIFSLIVFYGFEIFKNKTLVKVLSVAFSVVIFNILLLFVTDNNDWEIYKSTFEGYYQSNDYMFNAMSEFFSNRGYEYLLLYQIHILAMGICFIFFASKFNSTNTFVIISIYLLLQFVPLSNQIRYFVSFSFFLLSIYFLIIKGNKILFVLFIVLSLLSHSGIVLMFPFLYFYYKIKNEKFIKTVLISSIVFAAIFWIVYKTALIIFSQFASYFESEMISSMAGGVFDNFIWFIWIIYIVNNNKRLDKDFSMEISQDNNYQLLYKLSLFTIIFIPTSFFLQIISHRYVASCIIVWVSYLLYSLKYRETLSSRVRNYTLLIILSLVTFFYIYFLPDLILGVDGSQAATDILNSNSIFSQ